MGLGSTEEGFGGEKTGYGGSFQEKVLVDLAFLFVFVVDRSSIDFQVIGNRYYHCC